MAAQEPQHVDARRGGGLSREEQALSSPALQYVLRALRVRVRRLGIVGRPYSPERSGQRRAYRSIVQTASGRFEPSEAAKLFPLPWSAYVRLLSVEDPAARAFYEAEALRGGWTVRQLARQIGSQFYERTLLSKNKAAMLTKGVEPEPSDAGLPEEQVRDPFVLEFLDLEDEYSESDLEDALIRHLEVFLLELGGDFTFVGRQRRLRIGNACRSMYDLTFGTGYTDFAYDLQDRLTQRDQADGKKVSFTYASTYALDLAPRSADGAVEAVLEHLVRGQSGEILGDLDAALVPGSRWTRASCQRRG